MRLMHLFDRWRGRGAAPGRQEDEFRLLAENSADVLFHFGPDLKALYISPSAKHLLGWTAKEIMEQGGEAGSNYLLYPDDQPAVARALTRHFSGEVDELKLEFRVVHRDGSPVWVETNCRTVRDAAGVPVGVVLSMRDISLKKKIEVELSELARTDGLTGLANRRTFDDVLAREWARTLRDDTAMSLLIADVDHFKNFNDTNGHQVGDDCLRAVAAALKAVFTRPGDVVARYGGEEFGIVLPGTDQPGAILMAERARAAIEQAAVTHRSSETSGVVTVSIGVATSIAIPGGTVRMPEGLLQAADGALYRAKANGRNRVEAALLLSSNQEPQAKAG